MSIQSERGNSMLRQNRRANECPYFDLDLPSPTSVQMKSAVKGHDPSYRIRRKRSHWPREFGYAVLVLILLLAAFGSLFIIGEAVK